ncbi:unnamed protein product (macronuclear) [Paramecium tetraurelia]|uniref:Uncharacterized protein n=1 Tax=Paramecium tetraurelia TaxID=5888 RepID=A0ED06_PARTE|nr:uncharacterized protein GSPATT00004042001 [Paramecium tetraurelia]CAK93173.1 unnamed protein product [Paramecium tetraurelia]|eukprot:XP_001460570.1 hypothetical protein (macronuclear) [Paramecium tetraurelia strain d4-2]
MRISLKQPKSNVEVLLKKCQSMIDKLLDEEFNLDRLMSKLRSKKRRNNKASTGNVLQQIDENTLKEIQTFSRCQVAIKNEEKKVIEKQEKQGKQERQEKETTKRTTEVDPFEKLVNINMQIEQCLGNKVQLNIELLSNQNKIENESDMEVKINNLEEQIYKLTENRVYNDENVEVYIVQKTNKKRMPNLQINY